MRTNRENTCHLTVRASGVIVGGMSNRATKAGPLSLADVMANRGRLTGVEVCVMTGLSAMIVSRAKRGKRISYESACKLRAKFPEVDLDLLLGGGA